VFSVRRPSPGKIDQILRQACGADLTYAAVGATNGENRPAGYRHDLDQALLGTGSETFDRAVSALRRWKAHTGVGTEVFPREATAVEGEVALLLIHAAGLWTLAPFRVIYVVEEPDTFRFAYGTLPGHPEQGEASFAIKRSETDEVFFRLASFSRPVAPLARFAKPLARRIQRRYTLRYIAALREAIFAD
jgi:uncharacterized protein (UPF0548 family)